MDPFPHFRASKAASSVHCHCSLLNSTLHSVFRNFKQPSAAISRQL
jgi:hypothetical protein